MKTKLIWLVLALIIIAIIFSKVGENNAIVGGEFRPLELNPGDEFTYIKYDNSMYVLNYLIEDVTGDGTKDMVIVIGERNNLNETTASNIDIVIYEPNEEKFYNMKLKKFSGEPQKLLTQDLTGDGIQDIAFAVKDENSNINLRIVTFENGEPKEIFKAKDNKGIIVSGNFIDGFKAYIKCNKYNKELNVDLQDRKENYVSKGFFDDAGRLLKKESKITNTGFISFDFVQLDGYFGIQTTERVLGFDSDDLLDEITVIWKYENGKWNVKEAYGNMLGNLLY